MSYYEKRAAEYDDWWLGAGLFEQRERPGLVRGRLGADRRAAARCRRRGRSTWRAGRGSSPATCRATCTASTRARRCSRSRGRAARTTTFEVGDALAPRPGFERIFSSHFYGHLDAAQREAFLALPRDELVIVDSALRPDGQAEDWQERVLDDGSTHSVYKRWFTGAGLAEEIGGAEVLHDGPWFVAVRSSSPRS